MGSTSIAPAAWRDAAQGDVAAISAIERAVHTIGAERPAVYREKIALFGAGCRVLETERSIIGYGIAYPWRLDDVPQLDRFLGEIPPDADCLFVHDVAMLPAARRNGAGRGFVEHAARLARLLGLHYLALVSVYGTQDLWGRCGFAPSPSAAAAAQLATYGDTARYMVAKLT